MQVSDTTRFACGILLLVVPLIEYGGVVLLRSVVFRDFSSAGNRCRRELRHSGYTHSGTLLLLAVVCQFLVDLANLPPGVAWLVRIGVIAGAVLVPAGMLLSTGAPPTDQPEPAMEVIFFGDLLLAASVLILGAGLLGAFSVGRVLMGTPGC